MPHTIDSQVPRVLLPRTAQACLCSLGQVTGIGDCLPGHFSLHPPNPGRAMLPFGPRAGVLGRVHSFLPPSQPVPPASHRDEDLQLQLALRLSRQEQEKVAGRASGAGAGAGGGAMRD